MIIGIVFLNFLAITIIQNSTYIKQDMTLSSLAIMNSANAECSWWETCKERVESITVTCSASTTITRTYYKNSSKITVTGMALVEGGSITMQSGYQTSYSSDTTSGCASYNATRVNCPTDGSATCTEYKPC